MAEAVMYDERGEPAGMAPDQKFDWESYRAQARAKSLRQQENQRIAEQEVSDRQWMDMLQQNAATQDAAKAVAAALQFQAIRGYERDFRSAKSAGLSEEQAAIQALIRNPRAVSGTGLARTISELRPPFEPASTNLPGVGPVVRSGRYGERVQIVPPVSVEGKIADADKERLKVISDQEEAIRKSLTGIAVGELERSQGSNRLRQLDQQRQKILGGKPVEEFPEPVIAQPPQSTTPSIQPLPKSKAQLVTGTIYQTARGKARWNGKVFERVD